MEIYKPLVFDFEESEFFYATLESYFVDKILEINGENGAVRLALAGGTTPMPIYSTLVNSSSLPLDKIEIYQTDERFVDKKEETSNQKKILQALGPDVSSEIGELNFINTALPIVQAIKDYDEKLSSLDSDGGLFDLVILGIGPDGHIASLFPGGEYLKHQDKLAIETIAPSEFEVARRVSLTLEALLNSKEINCEAI